MGVRVRCRFMNGDEFELGDCSTIGEARAILCRNHERIWHEVKIFDAASHVLDDDEGEIGDNEILRIVFRELEPAEEIHYDWPQATVLYTKYAQTLGMNWISDRINSQEGSLGIWTVIWTRCLHEDLGPRMIPQIAMHNVSIPTYLLARAVRMNSLPIVDALLDAGAGINAVSSRGYTPMHEAVFSSVQIGIPMSLVRARADCNIADIAGRTPLHRAVITNSMTHVEYLTGLGDKCDVNIPNSLGWTPLHAAAKIGNKEILRLLLTRKANVNAQDPEGRTPLHVAVMSKMESVEVLLEFGADTTLTSIRRHTPLQLAEKSMTGTKHQVIELLRRMARSMVHKQLLLQEAKILVPASA